MSVMTDRFLRYRWSDIRKKIDGMVAGQVEQFTLQQRESAYTNYARLQYAYDGEREWTWDGEVKPGIFQLTRTK